MSQIRKYKLKEKVLVDLMETIIRHNSLIQTQVLPHMSKQDPPAPLMHLEGGIFQRTPLLRRLLWSDNVSIKKYMYVFQIISVFYHLCKESVCLS